MTEKKKYTLKDFISKYYEDDYCNGDKYEFIITESEINNRGYLRCHRWIVKIIKDGLWYEIYDTDGKESSYGYFSNDAIKDSDILLTKITN